MGTLLEYEIVGAPPWLTRDDDAPGPYAGTPEPGNYDFVVRAHVVENNISSTVSEKQFTGAVQFQQPVWQTPALQDASFTGVAQTVQVEATSYAARVRYSAVGAPDGATVSDAGDLQYVFAEPGEHIVTVGATAYAREGEEVVTAGLSEPSATRDFIMWMLESLDGRTAEEVLSDLCQSLVDGSVPPGTPDSDLWYSADPAEVDLYCDVRAFVYAAGPGSGQVDDVTGTLGLGGVDVATHTVSPSQNGHVITFPATQTTAETVHVVSGLDRRVFVLLFDRRDGTVSVSALPLHDDTGPRSASPPVTSPAPTSWSGASWTRGSPETIGAACFVSTARDARVARILHELVVPRPWPLPLWSGAYLVGAAMTVNFAYDGRQFEVLSLDVPGLTGIGTDVLEGTLTQAGSYDIRVRATEIDTQMYSTATVSLVSVLLAWTPASSNDIFARVGDVIDVTLALAHSHEVIIEAEPDTNESGLTVTVTSPSVQVSGTLLITGTHGVDATASTTINGSTVSSTARISYYVANQLPAWVTPPVSDLAMGYSETDVVIALSATAPEPVTYRISPDEIVSQYETFDISSSNLTANLPEGPRSLLVDAVVDDETIQGTTVRFHAFSKTETRDLAEIASDSERDLASVNTPQVSHATSYPASIPVYEAGMHIMYVFDIGDGSAILRCNNVDIVTHSQPVGGDPGSALSLAGETGGTVHAVDARRAVSVVSIYPDGVTRARTGAVDASGSAPVPGLDGDNIAIDFQVTGTASVGSVYVTPAFDPVPAAGASYALTSPYFVSSDPPAYVHTSDPFDVPAVTVTPDQRLRFEVIESNGVQLVSVDAETALISAMASADGAASVSLRARRTNGTWLDGTVPIEAITITWPPLDLGEATVGTVKRFAFTVTSTYDVVLDVPDSTAPNAITVSSATGASGELEIVPDQAGPVSVEVIATTKGVSRARDVSVLVRHTAPIWDELGSASVTVFARSAFERTVSATSSGVPAYSIASVSPVRAENEAVVSSDTGIIRSRLPGDTVIEATAVTPDGVLNEADFVLSVTAYEAGEVFGATVENPDGPQIVSLLGDVRSKVRYDIFARQLGAGSPMRFFPETDGVVLRDGGVLVYSIELDDASGGDADRYVALRIPGIADVTHAVAASGTEIDVRIHAPGANDGSSAPPPGRSADGAAVLASGSVPPDGLVSGSLGAVLIVHWEADGRVKVALAPSATPWSIVAPGVGAAVPDVNATDVSFDVADVSACAIGGHMISTFPTSARIADWWAGGAST